MQESLYSKHIDTMFGTKNMDSFTKDEVDETLENLLQCIPNNGKLYKYRKINDEKSFNFVYRSLLNGTIWSSRVDQFPDKTDCTIYYDPVQEAKLIEKLLVENPELILGAMMRGISKEVLKVNPSFDRSMLLRMIDCFDKDSGIIITSKALRVFSDYGCDHNESLNAIRQIQNYVSETIKEKEPIIKQTVENFLKFNEKIRHIAFVCSLCEDYKVKTMWEHYAANDGICIEYDYKKLKTMTYREKRFFCSTYKVIYTDNYEECTFIPLIKEYLEGKHLKSTNTELNKKFLLSTITKTNDYAYEKEWRTFHFNLHDSEKGIEMKANLVSGIIFDENAFKSERGKQILALAKQRNWEIKIRKLNMTSTGYQYLLLDDYMR